MNDLGSVPDRRLPNRPDEAARRLALVDDHHPAPAATAVVVQIHASDPISQLGIREQLRHYSEVRIVENDDPSATVALAVVDSADDYAVHWLRALHREQGLAIVLVVGQLDPRTLVPVVEAGVCAVIARADVTGDGLVRVLQAAARGDAELPPQLLRHLLDQVSRLNRALLEPRGLSFTGLTSREREILERLAGGLTTREVALELAYSERTIKTVLQELTIRLHLRNRTQAVAYAVRNGWI